MNFGPLLFLGVFITFLSAWIGMVFIPTASLARIKATSQEGSTLVHPSPYTGQQLLGRKVYQQNGCVYCHTQQVRGGTYNNDLERGWGSRRSHPQDYIYDYPVLLGTMRTGPDLANVGARLTNDNWHLTHLYDPQLITPGSVMAPFRYLFTVQKISGAPRPDALKFNFVFLTIAGDTSKVLADLKSAGFTLVEQRADRYVGAFDPANISALQSIAGVKSVEPYVPPGEEIVPSEEAINLVAYLRCLDHTYDLPPAENYGRLK